MRVSYVGELVRNLLGQGNNFRNPKVAKNPVVRFTRLLICKQSEKHENIAQSDALALKMRLRCAALPEDTGSICQKHRIVVAQVTCAQFPAACRFCQRGKPKIAISRLARSSCRDGQADRPASDNR